jgi:D-alanyl-D-alanine carboxypeptidase/D-alanyl-D-alanine-endopeptidase (penicillin-binding protein 4)
MPGLAFSQISSSMTLAPLPIDLKKEIELSGIPESAWGVVVLPIPSQVLMKKGFSGYGLNADRPLNPASVMKLVTTRAALGILGPDFRHQTRIATTGRLDAGVLKGDLFFQGGGDPKLVVEDLTEIVKRLKAMGIIRIEGNLVIDGTRFNEPEIDPGQFDQRPTSTLGPMRPW